MTVTEKGFINYRRVQWIRGGGGGGGTALTSRCADFNGQRSYIKVVAVFP